MYLATDLVKTEAERVANRLGASGPYSIAPPAHQGAAARAYAPEREPH
jgi:hypothetical protein